METHFNSATETVIGAGAATALHLVIAGIAVTLDVRALDPDARRQLAARYAGFAALAVPAGNCMVRLTVEPGPPYIDPLYSTALPTGPTPRPYEVRVAVRGPALDFTSYLEQGHMDFAAGLGQLTLRPAGSPENFLRAVYSRLCASQGGCLLHASGVIRAGKGYAFFGPSGAGKTTLARFSRECGATVLSDDIVILLRHGTRVWLHGAPFCGTGDPPEMARVNRAAALCGVFAPVKAAQHAVVRMGASDAVARLMSCVPFLHGDPASLAKVMCFCHALAKAVPVCFLHYRKDNGFWRTIDELDLDRLPCAA